MTLYPGTTVRVIGEFTDSGGAAVDPTVLTLKLKSPGGVVTTYTYNPGTIVRTTFGKYYCDVLLDKNGTWTYRWHINDATQGADEKKLIVDPSAF
jgi:hypothetical protein